MKLGIFVSHFRFNTSSYERIKSDKLGVIFVQNGIFHATVKENNRSSPLLEKSADFFVLSEDLETHGFRRSDVDGKVRVINYSDLVNLIFNEYEKLAWL
ncbi:MAG: DsrH/TusB family sulfur metabolism protein [Nitrospirota bacterium]